MSADHMAAVEQVIRDLIADNPDLPIRAEFFRPIRDPGFYNPLSPARPFLREYEQTPDCPDEWLVEVAPAAFEVLVRAVGKIDYFGPKLIGEVTVVPLPRSGEWEVDVLAVQGSQFHVELLAAIRAKAAMVDQMRGAVRR